MQPELEVLHLLDAYRDIWQRHFPDQIRRAQWHIVRYLCTRGRQGGSVGELSGFVRQIFLLDDATVRERVTSLRLGELCTIEPERGNITARSFIAPSPRLLELFDRHLAVFAERLDQTMARLADGHAADAPTTMDAVRRGTLLAVIDGFCEPWNAALDHVLAASPMSQARRLEARRHLLSPSHWVLLMMAVRHHYERSAGGGDLQADRMAAEIIQMSGQNFQTTRDHIGYLIEVGLLERRAGKALHVALTAAATQALHRGLGETAALWLRRLRPPGLPSGPTDQEETVRLRPGQMAIGVAGHRLRIVEPASARRHVPLISIPLTIGRSRPADLVLDGADISRAHCRIEMIEGQLSVTDLHSTNGTYVDGKEITGTVPLRRGAVLEIGRYVIEYQHLVPDEPASETISGFADGTKTVSRRRSTAGRSTRTKQDPPGKTVR